MSLLPGSGECVAVGQAGGGRGASVWGGGGWGGVGGRAFGGVLKPL